MATPTINQNVIQELYIAYFGRPADPLGLANSENALGSTAASNAQLLAFSANFSSSPEYTAQLAGETNAQIINNLYLNLFGRPADPTGLAFWSGQLANSSVTGVTLATLPLALIQGAQGSDITAINDKITAATEFTAAVNTNAEILGYSGPVAAASAKSWLATVVDAASLAAATTPAALNQAVINATTGYTFTLTQALAATPLPAVYTLSDATTSLGNLNVANAATSEAHVAAVIAGAVNGSTLTPHVTYSLTDTVANIVNVANAAIVNGATAYSLTDTLANIAANPAAVSNSSSYMLTSATINLGSGLTIAAEATAQANAQAIVNGATNVPPLTLMPSYTLADTLANIATHSTVVSGHSYALTDANINLGANLTVAAEHTAQVNAQAIVSAATNGLSLTLNPSYTLSDTLANIMMASAAVVSGHSYALTDASINLGNTPLTVAAVMTAEAQAQAVVNGASNGASWILNPSYSVADTLANITADSALVAGHVYSLTDPAGNLGPITDAQVALVMGATDAANYTYEVEVLLSTGIDNIQVQNDNTAILGVANGAAGLTATFTPGDTINGNGHANVSLTVSDASYMGTWNPTAIAGITVNGVQTVTFNSNEAVTADTTIAAGGLQGYNGLTTLNVNSQSYDHNTDTITASTGINATPVTVNVNDVVIHSIAGIGPGLTVNGGSSVYINEANNAWDMHANTIVVNNAGNTTDVVNGVVSVTQTNSFPGHDQNVSITSADYNVVLDGLQASNTATINDGNLQNLTIANDPGAQVNINGSSPMLNLSLKNDSSLSVAANSVNTLNVNVTGSSPTLTFNGTGLTTENVTGSTLLTQNGATPNLKTVSIGGNAGFTADLSGTAVTNVRSTSTGNISVNLGTQPATFTGGLNGSDLVIIAANPVNPIVGSVVGQNEIILNAAASVFHPTNTNANIDNFATVGLGQNATGTYDFSGAALDTNSLLAGVMAIDINGSDIYGNSHNALSGNVTVIVDTNTALDINSSTGHGITYVAYDLTAANDQVTTTFAAGGGLSVATLAYTDGTHTGIGTLNFAVGGVIDTIGTLNDSGLANLNVNGGGTLEIGNLNINDGLASGSNSVTFNGNGQLHIDTLNFGSGLPGFGLNNGTLTLTNSGIGDVQLGLMAGTGLTINDSLGNHTSTVNLDGAIGGTVQIASGLLHNVGLTLNAGTDNDWLNVNLQGGTTPAHYGTGADTITLGMGSDEVWVGKGIDTIVFGTHAAGYDSVDLTATIGTVAAPLPAVTSVYTNGTGSPGDKSLDIVQGLATGDTLYIPGSATINAGSYVNNLSNIDQLGHITFATGFEVGGIAGQQFQYSAAGTDTLVTYDTGAGHYNSVVLVGIAEHSGATVAAGAITLH